MTLFTRAFACRPRHEVFPVERQIHPSSAVEFHLPVAESADEMRAQRANCPFVAAILQRAAVLAGRKKAGGCHVVPFEVENLLLLARCCIALSCAFEGLRVNV